MFLFVVVFCYAVSSILFALIFALWKYEDQERGSNASTLHPGVTENRENANNWQLTIAMTEELLIMIW